jgi:SAM-dependent methyltransferase
MWRRWKSDRGNTSDLAAPSPPATPDAFIHEAFWIVLARAPSAEELPDLRGVHAETGDAGVLRRLLSSPEFHLIFSGWRDDIGIGKDPVAHEAGLRSIGPADHFVNRAYQLLLGRDADEAGRAHYVEALAAGEARRQVVRILVVSDEFEARYTPIASQQGGGFVPRDVQLCELANPAKWDNPDWLRLLRSLQVLPHHKLAMHRKSYEWTQLLFGLERLGRLGDDVSVLSVGAGHECVLYWLANRVGRVVATDTYEGRWQDEGALEGDARVVDRPEHYAPFPYREDRLRFQRMDGRQLAFERDTFDVVYSLSSIEHFGGFAGAQAAVTEMARVLKPGGVLVVATEYILAGPPHDEAFAPEDIRALFDGSGLRLVEPIDDRVYQRHDYRPVDLRRNLHQRPHMVVEIDGTRFTSVMAFLIKD